MYTRTFTPVKELTHVMCATRDLLKSVALIDTNALTPVRSHTNVIYATRNSVI